MSHCQTFFCFTSYRLTFMHLCHSQQNPESLGQYFKTDKLGMWHILSSGAFRWMFWWHRHVLMLCTLRVGEWHAESELQKWEPHWERVNLRLLFSYSLRQIPKLWLLVLQGVHEQEFSSLMDVTQNSQGLCFPFSYRLSLTLDMFWLLLKLLPGQRVSGWSLYVVLMS